MRSEWLLSRLSLLGLERVHSQEWLCHKKREIEWEESVHEKTVDTLKTGNPDTRVTGIAVTIK